MCKTIVRTLNANRMEKKVFSLEDLQAIANYDGQTYNFDLSRIDVDDFEPLLNTLYMYGLTNIHGIGFNCDLQILQKAKKESKTKKHPPRELENSAFRNNDRIVPLAIAMLSRILPRTESIEIIKFRGLRLEYKDIDVLAQSIEECRTLRVIKMQDIELKKRGFRRLAEAVKRQGVITIQCRNCLLNDTITDLVLDLIECHTMIQKEAERKAEAEADKSLGIVCLSTIDLRDNHLTPAFLERVEEVLDASPMLRLDVRGNPEITETDVHSPKAFAGKTEPRKIYGSLAKTAQSREVQLEAENLRLKGILAQLTNGSDVAVLRTNLYAVGERAQELARHIDDLDSLCSRMEAELAKRPPPLAELQQKAKTPKPKRRMRAAHSPKRLVHREYLK